jgi:transketolase
MSNTIELAKKIRIHALEMTSVGGSSHIGSILSIADILAVLYGRFLTFDVNNPKSANRDRFILSKGHAGAGVYAALAEVGFFNKDLLKNHYKNGSIFSGHVSHKGVPGVEISTGSLGHGLPVATGIAKAAKINSQSHSIVVLMSDGEFDEGSNWESLLFASHHKLDNLIIIVDYNKLQSIKSVEETLNLEPFNQKINSFGCTSIQINGHDHEQIYEAMNKVEKNKPLFIIANTVKGRGVSFMENNVLWHYKTAVGDDYIKAHKELTT